MLKRLPHVAIFSLTLLCTPLFFCLPLHAKSFYIPLENQPVSTIEIIIKGEKLSTQTIKQTILSRIKTRSGDLFSQTTFDSDLKTLAQDYHKIEPRIESKDGKIAIILTIWLNPTIRDLTWEGNLKVTTKQLQAEFGISPGQAFDQQRFNKAFHQLKTYYIKKGYFEAELDYQLIHDEKANAVDIIISIQEKRAGKIKKICFCNFTKQEEEEILCLLATKKYNFFLSWFNGSGIYNEEMAEHDQFQVLNFLQNEGYADATVSLNVVEAKEKDRIIVYITADKGPRYTIDTITLEGNSLFTKEELLKCLPIRTGAFYSPEALHESIRKLTNYYGRCGYIETAINYIPKPIEGQCAYAIHFTIEEGESYRVGLIKVFGNRCTQTPVILHETLLIPGEVFNLEKLQLTEKRLMNVGYFDSVNVYAVKSEHGGLLSENYRDVHIEVEEGSTGHLGAFFGFSSVENIFGGINLTERNFNYKGLNCFWRDGLSALRGGGEYAHITLSFGAKSRSYLFSWTKPYFRDTQWSVGFDVSRTTNDYYSDHYEVKDSGFTLRAAYECNAFTRVSNHYRISYTDTHYDKKATNETKRKEGKSHWISAFGTSWQYDSTNHPLRPNCGLRSVFSTEIAGIGGGVTFLSFGYSNAYFYDLWGYGLLKLRDDIRFIQPLGSQDPDKIPLGERYFLGGDTTVRGYRSYRLGPKFKKDHHKHKDDEEEPRGGLSLQYFSAEISRPLFSLADGFAFFDAGALSKRRWNINTLYMSVGLGCYIQIFGANSPPLMLGYGWPINPKTSHDVKKFFITAGGKF